MTDEPHPTCEQRRYLNITLSRTCQSIDEFSITFEDFRAALDEVKVKSRHPKHQPNIKGFRR